MRNFVFLLVTILILFAWLHKRESRFIEDTQASLRYNNVCPKQVFATPSILDKSDDIRFQISKYMKYVLGVVDVKIAGIKGESDTKDVRLRKNLNEWLEENNLILREER